MCGQQRNDSNIEVDCTGGGGGGGKPLRKILGIDTAKSNQRPACSTLLT